MVKIEIDTDASITITKKYLALWPKYLAKDMVHKSKFFDDPAGAATGPVLENKGVQQSAADAILADEELERAAYGCEDRVLKRPTPCGIFTCACHDDWRKEERAAAIATFHYTEPQIVEIGKTYDAVASSAGGVEYTSVDHSFNGEMGAATRGATETGVKRHASGVPTGGEWIEITARNLPPYDDLIQRMRDGEFKFVFGRTFDHENDESVVINHNNGNHKFGMTGKPAAADGGAFFYGGAPIDKTTWATKDYSGTTPGDLGGNTHGGTIAAFGTVKRKSCQKEDLVLVEVETAARPARFMCRTPPRLRPRPCQHPPRGSHPRNGRGRRMRWVPRAAGKLPRRQVQVHRALHLRLVRAELRHYCPRGPEHAWHGWH
jgi:hypothetical protein